MFSFFPTLKKDMNAKKRYNVDGGSNVEKYVRRSATISGVGLFFVIAIAGMFIGLLAGGLKTTTVMNGMSRGMKYMVKTMEAPSDYVQQLLTKFPSDQLEVSARQIFGTLANVHKISSRTEFLMNTLEPQHVTAALENVATVLKHVDGITGRFERIMNQVSDDEAVLIKGHLMGILEQTHNLVGGVKQEQISEITAKIAQIDVTQINKLVESTQAIEQRLKDLHEIKINI